jgi:predicted enzyme related to lactoylglutathione lyase
MHSETLQSNLESQLANEASLLLFESGKLPGSSSTSCHLNVRKYNKQEVNMFTKIGTISVGVTDQDKALDFYVNKLGFEKIDDQPMSETERWLEVAPPGAQTHIMLGLRGQSGGDKTGFTGFVLHTDNIEETCATLKARGVNISHELSTEPWGKWAQFTDPDGNDFGVWAPAW